MITDKPEKIDVFKLLKADGFLDYGSVFTGEYLREIALIEMPNVGTKAQFDNAALEELSIVGYIRNQLLDEGKYLKSNGKNYRILSPSENADQVAAYMKSADRKLKNAVRLQNNTPKDTKEHDSTSARAMMKREQIKSQSRFSALMA